jgi:hypothetical protein
METIVAIIAGAAAKVYDDGIDGGIIKDETHKKILETLQCYLLGALSMNNFTFSLVNLVINLLNHLTNKEAFANPYEFSLLAVYPIFLFLSFGTRDYLTRGDLIIFLILSLSMFFEPLLITEDKSPRKFIIRLFLFLEVCLIAYLDLGLSSGIYLTILYFLGYFFISTLYQGYHVLNIPFTDFKKQFAEGITDILNKFSH